MKNTKTNLERAQQVMQELKEQGMSEKELNELSLLVLLEAGCRVKNPQADGHCI